MHPGGIQTELGRHLDPSALHALVDNINQQLAAQGKGPFQWKTVPYRAPRPSVWAGVVATAEEVGGKYCENCHVGQVVADDVAISPVSEGVRGYALDAKNAEARLEKERRAVERPSESLCVRSLDSGAAGTQPVTVR